ncbi:MAG TPA: hypothetical protein VN784_03335 [Candidatus Limnocylindrales bacterium]|nr:hypothetical protein [Candidatus Limnocylindrales bacterium]
MKKTVFNLRFILALIAVTLAGLTARTWGAPFPAGSYINTFSTGGNSSPFAGSGSVASWISWYDTPGTNSPITNDVNTLDAGAGPNCGSLMVVCPFTHGNQNLFFGTFSNNAAYDWSQTISNLNQFDFIRFDVQVKPIDPITGLIQQTNTDGNFGSLEVGVVSSVGPTPTFFGSVTIPGSATNSWVSLTMPINHAVGNLQSIGGVAFNYNNYAGYPTNHFVFWIGHLVLHYNPTQVIGPPTLLSFQKPVSGLNLIDTQPINNDNRYQVETANSTGYGFVDKPNVTYSWNIKSFPTNSPNGYQQHFFIVNGTPGPYDQAADWNLPNCIFITIQQDTNGFAYMAFRYKTNEPSGNGMIYNTATNSANGWPVEPVGFLATSNYSALGTWSVTFNNQTNVTLTAPHGQTTNFVFDPASAALFADPATPILGAQPNDTFVGGEAVVYNWFSITGNDSPFTDIFTNDSQLNTNYWKVLANDPNGVVLVPPNAVYWLPWTLPDSGFGLQTNSNLATPGGWNDAVALSQIQSNTNRQALLGANLVPSNQGYYRLLARTYKQLQVLFPGETNAPDTPTGKIGTPNPASYNIGDTITVTVNGCDSTWHVVNFTGDEIYLYSNAGNNFVPQGQQPLANGTVQMTCAFLASSTTNTITAGDNNNTNILQGTSSIITIN